MQQNKKKRKLAQDIHRAFQIAAPLLSIVYVLMGGVLFFGYLGNLLDQKWDSSPFGVVTGVFIGFGLGIYNMIKVLQHSNRK
ncbi:AtpZ/AtpI family protein [Caldithrix abyssi]